MEITCIENISRIWNSGAPLHLQLKESCVDGGMVIHAVKNKENSAVNFAVTDGSWPSTSIFLVHGCLQSIRKWI